MGNGGLEKREGQQAGRSRLRTCRGWSSGPVLSALMVSSTWLPPDTRPTTCRRARRAEA